MSGLSATQMSFPQKSEEVRMPKLLKSDQTKSWHIYKERDEVEQTYKNWGPGTIQDLSWKQSQLSIKKKKCIWHSMFLLVKVHRENCIWKAATALMTGSCYALMDWKSGPSQMHLFQIW